MTYEITIPGTPVAKGRPRVGRYGTYTPKKTATYESYVQYCWAAEYGAQPPSEQPLEVSVIFYMPIPKSITKKAREAITEGVTKHTKKPDLDNMAKAILDALNGLAYKDDSQIYSLTLYKTYDDSPSTTVTIKEAG
ncbi:MAG: RusA family crossover junction endodeoxyribonuclease [Eubacteriales bacterium]|nr:RusA family crossover junction endodeoxyribonuclease [Eubacteriales bacterium]